MLVATVALLYPAAVFGQADGNGASAETTAVSEAQPSTQAISGGLFDPSGATIAKAQLSLLTFDNKPIAEGTTDKSGSFHFDNVPPGKYTLDFQAEGFHETRVNLNLATTRQAPLRITMPIAVLSESITVASGESVPLVSLETSENQSANTIDRNALDRVPVFDQDYIATMSRFLDDNSTGTNGVTLVVNGIEANGPGVTPSAVQEVKINNNPYSARFSRPGRARLEIVTKSGSPAYHGSLNFLFRDSVFDARNAFAMVKPPERRQYYEGSVTGPIGQSKRTSFLLALDEDLQDQQAVIDSEAAAAAESLGLGPVAQTIPNPAHHFFGSGRIFHDFSNGDQFWIGYSYEHRTVENQNVGGTTLPGAGTNTHFLEH